MTRRNFLKSNRRFSFSGWSENVSEYFCWQNFKINASIITFTFLLLLSMQSRSQDMGIDYVNDNTGLVWFDISTVSANWSYICLNGCFSGTVNGNRVEREFSGLTLGETYAISAQIQDNTLGQILPSGNILFENGGTTPTPSCSDGIQNGDETGVDCGGSCPACPTEPNCSDGIQNGDETGVDCGGPCPACPGSTTIVEAESGSLQGGAQIYTDGAASNGQGVAYLDEVGNGFMLNNTPTASSIEITYASQNSGTISILVNGSDAGNISFSSTGTWVGNYGTISYSVSIPVNSSVQIVNQSGDVALNVDYINFIGTSEPSCSDGIQNGNETGIDCGGSCPNCPTCDDGIQNGNETGPDCGGDCPQCPTPDPIVDLSNSSGTQILVGGEGSTNPGFTLYTFDEDEASGFSSCEGGCATTWPPLLVNSLSETLVPTFSSPFDGVFGVSGRCDGTLQLTYNNEPLYFYIGDNAAGNTNGDGLNGTWHIVDGTSEPIPCTGSDIPSATISKTDETNDGAEDGSITFTFVDDGGSRTNIEFSIDGGNSYPYNVADNSGSTTIDNLSPGSYDIWTRWGDDECPTDLGTVTINTGNDPCDPNSGGVEGDDFVFGLNSEGIAYHLNPGHSPAFKQICLNGFCVESTLNPDKSNRYEVDFSSSVTSGATYALQVRIQGDGMSGYETGQCIYDISVQMGQGVESTPCYNPSSGGGGPALPDPVLAIGSTSSLGAFLIGSTGTDFPGYTMYVTSSSCNSGCLDTWPPVLVTDPDLVNDPGGITDIVGAINYGQVDCMDMYQATLNGQPLYFYSGDNNAGDTNGDNISGWSAATVNRLPKLSDQEHMKPALKTPINGRNPAAYGWVHDVNGRQIQIRAGEALLFQFSQSHYVDGVGSVYDGPGNPEWTILCTCNQKEFYEAPLNNVSKGVFEGQIPGNCYDEFYYFFRYKKAGLPSDDPGTQIVYSGLFEYDEQSPNDRIDPSQQGTITSNSANWMRFRHPRAHDGNTELIFNSLNNSGMVRALDRYSTTVTTGGNGTNINAGVPNILRVEALDNGLIYNSNPAYVYNQGNCCGSQFDYGNVITYEITIGSGAQISSQLYNTFQHVVVGKGFESSIPDPRLNLAGRAATTMEFAPPEAAYEEWEKDAIFTQHLTTLTNTQDVDDFLEGHHLFHGLTDQFDVVGPGATPVFGSVKIGDFACQDCHFRDGRGTEVFQTPRGPRLPPAVFGVGLLEWIEGAEVGLRWDGGSPNVRDRTEEALQEDHGVNPSSIPTQDLDRIISYVEHLTVPNRNAATYLDQDVVDGHMAFIEVGCTSCHQETQVTSNSAPEEFRNIVIRPYTDMKLHNVNGGNFRTAPLWGLGRNIDLLERNGMSLLFMHNGSASTLEGAIQDHSGDASSVRAAYNALSNDRKANLIKFLESL